MDDCSDVGGGFFCNSMIDLIYGNLMVAAQICVVR
jgi:hypothetical protein